MEWKYNPKDYVDYLRDSMTSFQDAYLKKSHVLMTISFDSLYFNTKQAVKEHVLSSKDRDDILDYYGGLMPDA